MVRFKGGLLVELYEKGTQYKPSQKTETVKPEKQNYYEINLKNDSKSATPL